MKSFKKSPDEILASSTKSRLVDICKFPDYYDFPEVINLWNAAEGNAASFARALVEFEYKRGYECLPYELDFDGAPWIKAVLYQAWQNANWDAVASAIAPVIPKLKKAIKAWEEISE